MSLIKVTEAQPQMQKVWSLNSVKCFQIEDHYMDKVVRKPVFGVFDQGILKQACSATETSYKTEISIVASLDFL